MSDDELLRIKRLAMLAMFSPGPLLSQLVLKGGNLLDLVYDVAPRSSIDLDFSMECEFPPDKIDAVREFIETALLNTFSANGYHVFDIRFTEKPRCVASHLKHFWGGYQILFKVIPESLHAAYEGQPRELRVRALPCGAEGQKAFTIDISKFEYCRPKRAREVDGQTIYVYTPEMLVFEKLRAICQQMPQYASIVATSHRTARARARDFFDIATILQSFRLNLTSVDSIDLVQHIFSAKSVPLALIGLMPQQREYHRPDFFSVQSTLKPGVRLRDYDFYFDYVIEHCVLPLEPLWKIQPPTT